MADFNYMVRYTLQCNKEKTFEMRKTLNYVWNANANHFHLQLQLQCETNSTRLFSLSTSIDNYTFVEMHLNII